MEQPPADMPRHRPMAFDKMENLIKEMQDPVTGVPVRSQKLFLTFVPAVFMGYDLVEWLIERFGLEDSNNVEASNLANQLCQHGYFFPINDSKNLIFKDDSSLYRFQSPYYWPWQQMRCGGGTATGSSGPSSAPLSTTDNVEYAIYLVKRTLRNKQRHGLEDYELEALANLKKNLSAKWDFITMQAEEQVKVSKERKKGDKIVSDSQERAYWRVVRPPPGTPSALEPCPVPTRITARHKRRSLHQLRREVDLLKASLDRTRVKVSIALDAIMAYTETHIGWDPVITPPQPSNPWVSDDTMYWQINSAIVDTPSEKRVEKWALSLEELISDPTGLQEFTSFLRKEYSHENIRFWLAVMDLRRCSQRDIQKKLNQIYEEFLKAGAPCEINIDGATMEQVHTGLKTPNRFSLDAAAEHVYALLLKKDCYPRFIRSEHFKILLNAGRNIQPKKRFFGFGGPVKKKSGVSGNVGSNTAGGSSNLSRRRGSDRSLSGSAHELAVSGVTMPPPHSHSQSNISDLPYREPTDDESSEATTTWDPASGSSSTTLEKNIRRTLPQQNTLDEGIRRVLVQQSTIEGVSTDEISSKRVLSQQSTVDCGFRIDTNSRRLAQQNTLDGGLRGAGPPIRRLSAIEPLCSPPHMLYSSHSPPKALPPTISIISATEEAFAEVSICSFPPEELSESTMDVIIPSECDSAEAKERKSSIASEELSANSEEIFEKKEIELEPIKQDVSVLTESDKAGSIEGHKNREKPTEAPLAECEDMADEDENFVKVPSLSLRRVSEESEPTSETVTAQKDEQSTDNENNTINVDNNKVKASKVPLRNDICPWEDESSSDADPPFVKTYSTLGYL